MKISNCLVCKTEFYGRDNQIFCSSDCKNKHHNVKSKLFYRAGKFGEGQIAAIQEQIYLNNDRFIKTNDNFTRVEESYKAELAELRSDYTELSGKYEGFKKDLERIRGKYVDSFNNARKSEAQLALITELGEMFAPALGKLTENLLKTKKE